VPVNLWEFLDLPAGSAATLSGSTTAAASFTPDLPGPYRVQLTTNGGGPGNVQVLIAGVRFSAAGVLVDRGWMLPALGEAGTENNFAGQLRGWSAAWEFILADLLGVAAVAVTPREVALVSGLQRVGPGAAQRISSKVVDLLARYPLTWHALTRHVRFECYLATENAADTTTVRLRDVTGSTVLATFTESTVVGGQHLSAEVLAGVSLPSQLDVELETSSLVNGALCLSASLIISYE
jgi:hypothetical protein